jgi:hypothetical protein
MDMTTLQLNRYKTARIMLLQELKVMEADDRIPSSAITAAYRDLEELDEAIKELEGTIQ